MNETVLTLIPVPEFYGQFDFHIGSGIIILWGNKNHLENWSTMFPALFQDILIAWTQDRAQECVFLKHPGTSQVRVCSEGEAYLLLHG